MKDFGKLLEGTLRSVIETGGDLAESGNYEESQEFMSVLKELTELKGGIEAERRLLDEFKRVPSATVFESFKAFNLRNANPSDRRSLEVLKEYNELTWECGPGYGNRRAYPLLDHENESEGLTMQTRDSLTCPISQSLLKNPVKNPHCNHIYSRDAIEGLCREGQVIACPMAGCQKTVSRGGLVPDEAVMGKIKRIEQRIFK